MLLTDANVCIRRARPDEAEALNALIMRSKAYWGYEEWFLAACRPLLLITPEDIAREPVYCASVRATLAGVLHLKILNHGEVDLDHLFVEPAFIGHGIGGLLWRHAVDCARELGADGLVLSADPHARPFYERMGAVVIGEEISPIFAGRTIPHMRYSITREVN